MCRFGTRQQLQLMATDGTSCDQFRQYRDEFHCETIMKQEKQQNKEGSFLQLDYYVYWTHMNLILNKN